MYKKTNIKALILNKINKCIFISDFASTNQDNFLDNLCNILKDNRCIVVYGISSSSKNAVKTGLKIRQLCSVFDGILLINKRADIAKIINADGILLDKNDYSIDEARKILDSEKFFAYLPDEDCKDIVQSDFMEFDFFIADNKKPINKFKDLNIFIMENIDDNGK